MALSGNQWFSDGFSGFLRYGTPVEAQEKMLKRWARPDH